MDIQRNVDLTPFNTLALPGQAEHFSAPRTLVELQETLVYANQHRLPVTVLGGGSNTVVVGNVQGLVIHPQLKGIRTVDSDSESTLHVTCAAGEDWPTLVEYSLAQGWFGLENLSLIPGTAGAAPIQNIGAYGVELDQRLVSLEAVDRVSGDVVTLSKSACEFSYRDSVFKHRLKDRLVISQVTLVLSAIPKLCLDYPELKAALGDDQALTPQSIHRAVCALRRAKLPDPRSKPNAGSFFKNPVISSGQGQQLQALYPDLPLYQQGDGRVKLPAAWLIDRAGWKGLRRNTVGVHDRQPLVLVHYGNGNGQELLTLAEEIMADIKDKYSICLEMEPVVIGSKI